MSMLLPSRDFKLKTLKPQAIKRENGMKFIVGEFVCKHSAILYTYAMLVFGNTIKLSH